MHYHRCVPAFGNLRIIGYLLLPAAYRSLSRPSSAPSAKASALCSFSLDLCLACLISVNQVFFHFVNSLCDFLAFLVSRFNLKLYPLAVFPFGNTCLVNAFAFSRFHFVVNLCFYTCFLFRFQGSYAFVLCRIIT